MDNDTKDKSPASIKRESKKKANWISRLFMCWVCPVLMTGNRRDVEEEDLIVPGQRFDSDQQGVYFERYWLDEVERSVQQNRPPSLWRAVVRAYWLMYMPGGLLLLVFMATRTIQPLLFSQLLSYWSVESPITRTEAYYYAAAMLGLNGIGFMCSHHNTLFVNRFSIKVKVASSSLLFRKLLRTSQVGLQEVAGGKLVNLMSNDIARFDYSFIFLHYLWLIPIQAAVVLYFLWEAAGYAPFVGLFSMIIIFFPIQAGLTKLTAIMRRNTAGKTDLRIKLMNEIIQGIQVLKMYAWEKPFEIIVKRSRSMEMNALRKSLFIRSVFMGFMMYTERITIFITILTLVLSGSMITATTIYPIQQYFSIILMNMTLLLPFAIASLSELFISLERIQEFLLLDERKDLAITPKTVDHLVEFKRKRNEPPQQNEIITKTYSVNENEAPLRRQSDMKLSEYSIEMSGVKASWTNSKDDSDLTLKNVSMRLRRGKLCAVIGAVGSGKSSLLQVLLKELPISKGSFKVNGSISYACQESWLFPETVRENILFGLPYESRRYREVVKVCCLLPDFDQFPYGDLSLVGERGVSLSGGQRARINLARAVYREADVYLLDDPLSAVDANVGRQLYEKCIQGYLRDKTCILVTHQIHFVKTADYIVILNEGTIDNMGTYDEVVKSGKDISLLAESIKESEGGEGGNKKQAFQRGVSVISVKSEENAGEEKAQVQEAEERAKGNLKWSIVSQYLKAVQSWCLVGITLITLLLAQGAATATDYWISYWTNAVNAYEQDLPEGEEPDPGWQTDMGVLLTWQFLLIHGCLVLGIVILVHVRITAFVFTTMRASKNLYNQIFKNLIRATMRFFDTNPSGRVLNRFSKDTGAMDEMMPRSFLEALQMYMSMASILVLNAIALWWTLIPTAVLVVIFVSFLRWYLNAAQAVKRLEGTTKSPVFGMLNSTINGLSTIRSSNSQKRLVRRFDDTQDVHTSAFYTFMGGSAAFGLYLDFLCLVYLAAVIIIFLVVDFGDVVPVGSVGLAVSQSMVLTMMLQMSARFTADFLAQMTSVERVLEYTKLPEEEHMDVGPNKPPKEWPQQGSVKFQNVYMRYGDDPPVLIDVNFFISSGWKVGVVGRTGAGKSSLISALFRLSNVDGIIEIDGVNTYGIAKQELRAKISIIPQEPVLFSATIRYNLDPFDHYSDDDIWRALEQVELKDVIPALDYKVTEGGGNFSVGQRQLVCLARAILRSNKVLVMDEATANVDPQTDALIQKAIRREFASCTVITIAHRLNTIMDSDRALVMSKGEVAEFEHPYVLLSNPNSAFSLMVKETGDSTARALFEVTKTKYFADNPQVAR